MPLDDSPIPEQLQKFYMVSGSLYPTSFFDVSYSARFAVMGQRPRREGLKVVFTVKRASEAAERVSEAAGREYGEPQR